VRNDNAEAIDDYPSILEMSEKIEKRIEITKKNNGFDENQLKRIIKLRAEMDSAAEDF
jgi:hypothetical protein